MGTKMGLKNQAAVGAAVTLFVVCVAQIFGRHKSRRLQGAIFSFSFFFMRVISQREWIFHLCQLGHAGTSLRLASQS